MRTEPRSGPPASEAPASGVNGTKGRSAASAAAAAATPGHSSRAGRSGAGRWIARRHSAVALIGKTPSVLRYHWLASILIAAGVPPPVLPHSAHPPATTDIDPPKYPDNPSP